MHFSTSLRLLLNTTASTLGHLQSTLFSLQDLFVARWFSIRLDSKSKKITFLIQINSVPKKDDFPAPPITMQVNTEQPGPNETMICEGCKQPITK